LKNTHALSLILIFITLASCSILQGEAEPVFRGAVYGSPAPPPNFALPGTDGQLFELDKQTGRVILLFFGYTNCPDVCPQTLGTVRSALADLSEDERRAVRFVFISVDPQRDSLDSLGGYLEPFQADFLGIVPDPATLETLLTDYGVFVERQPADASGFYPITHSGVVFVIDKAGLLRLGFFNETSADDMLHDVRILLEE